MGWFVQGCGKKNCRSKADMSRMFCNSSTIALSITCLLVTNHDNNVENDVNNQNRSCKNHFTISFLLVRKMYYVPLFKRWKLTLVRTTKVIFVLNCGLGILVRR